MTLSHVNKQGNSKMVDVSDKVVSKRTALAVSSVEMKPETLQRIKDGGIKKGDVLAVAQIAGIMAAKKTHEVIPMCHPLPLTGVDIKYEFKNNTTIEIYATVKVEAKTGVEMESLTAASVAALTIYDMCKAIDQDMVITETKLLEKTGGKAIFRRL